MFADDREMLDYFLLATLLVVSNLGEKVDNALCFGALKVDLPVRYLHIQLRSGEKNITQSIGLLNISISGLCRYRSQLLDYYDGSYILRIRLWSSCPQMIINIHTLDNVSLCDSPILIKKADGNLLYSEYCDCPSWNISKWMEEAHCSSQYSQLDRDLSQWSTINFKQVLINVKKKWAKFENRFASSLCHYQIVNNNLHRECFGEHTGFRLFVDAAFTSLMRKMYLPNTEFIFNLGDWPLVKKYADNEPIISWCGSEATRDIVLPTYELMKSVIDSLESVTLDIHTVRGKKRYKWQEKKDSALRLEVAKLSRLNPDLLDAGITKYFFFNQSQYGPTMARMSFPDFFQHKFVLSIDGTVAAYRLPFLLAGDSVIFKSKSLYYEHFYADLKEGLHYFEFNGSDLIERIKWARTQDYNETLQAMRQFALQYLQPLDIFCYYANFVQKYTNKLKDAPTKPLAGMEDVPHIPLEKQSNDESCDCLEQNKNYKTKNNKQEL
ncbi:unnamed protein product [Thelazia callipaeda]|uniref:CAP10 domain-containing protein n=1 Tax=Thelazia callipaeda TaxID=103827 RepID=A0A0N5CVP5_THECL|nr:unnamed protein product [Thelazia callipaeda]